MCEKLKSVTLTGGISEIRNDVFWCCEMLETIEIPKGVEVIGEGAFDNCRKLTTVILPESVAAIPCEFTGCDSLSKFSVSKDNKAFSNDEYGVLYNKDNTKLISYPDARHESSYHVADSVKEIGNKAFYSHDYLSSITFGENLETIGDYAFYGCMGLLAIDFGDKIKTIGEKAFCNCGAMTVTFGKSLQSIGSMAFYPSKNTVFYKGTEDEWKNVSNVSSPFFKYAITYEYGAARPITSVTLNKDKLMLTSGNSTFLSATLSPENATNKNVVWSSSDE